MNTSRVALCAAVMLLVPAIVVPAATAQASVQPAELWGPSDGGHSPWEPVAAAGDGQTVVAWSASEEGGFASTIFLSRHGAGSSWGAPEAVSRDDDAKQNGGPGGQNGKQGLAVDAHGNALLAWEGENNTGSDLYIDEVPNGQPARAAVDFWHDKGTINGIDQVTVSFDSAGDATVMWRAGSGLYLARRPAGGSFGEPVRIADELEDEKVNWQSFASGANGDVVVGGDWNYGGMAAWVVGQSSSGSAGMQVLQREHEYTGSVHVAMAPDGEAVAAWYTEERDSETDGWLTVATRSPGATSFSAPRNLVRVPNLEGLALAVSPSGEASLIYNKVNELVAVSRAAGGQWRAPEELGLWAKENPAAAYDPAGDLYVAWHHYESNTNENAYYTATRPAGGAFDGHAHLISGPISGIGQSPALAASNTGAFVTWAVGGYVEAAGPFQAPWEKEVSTTPNQLTSEPEVTPSTSGPDDESPTKTATGGQPAPVEPLPLTGVAAPKAVQPNALVSELNATLKALSKRLDHLAGGDFRFRAPRGGVLTIRIARSAPKGLGAGSGSLLLGRWTLPHAGSANLRLASSPSLAALAAKFKLQLTATFRPTQGTATTERLGID